MSDYFDLEANRIKLDEVLKKWHGTQYWHMGDSTGGVDCLKLIACILIDAEILQTYKSEKYYSTDWYLHGTEQKVLNSIQDNLKYLQPGLYLYETSLTGVKKYGDLLCCITRNKEIISHVGLYLPRDLIFHCVERVGVCVNQLNPNWGPRLKKVFRLGVY